MLSDSSFWPDVDSVLEIPRLATLDTDIESESLEAAVALLPNEYVLESDLPLVTENDLVLSEMRDSAFEKPWMFENRLSQLDSLASANDSDWFWSVEMNIEFNSK